jgi:DNA polymerase
LVSNRDQEDRAGLPFVGPAGKLLHSALDEASVDTSKAYFTNVVKHFKWNAGERGKRRIVKSREVWKFELAVPGSMPSFARYNRESWCF